MTYKYKTRKPSIEITVRNRGAYDCGFTDASRHCLYQPKKWHDKLAYKAGFEDERNNRIRNYYHDI